MILGIEIVLTLAGFYMLIMGKGWGKGAPSHWQFRLVGVFALTLVPFAIVCGIILGAVWMLTHPNLSEQQFKAGIRWPSVILEAAVVGLYATIVTLWDKALRRKIDRDAAAAPFPTTPDQTYR